MNDAFELLPLLLWHILYSIILPPYYIVYIYPMHLENKGVECIVLHFLNLNGTYLQTFSSVTLPEKINVVNLSTQLFSAKSLLSGIVGCYWVDIPSLFIFNVWCNCVSYIGCISLFIGNLW